ncbi:MAG: hypothetical protein WD929_07645 [Steroidobacteraceae bacterium]
MRSKTVAAGLVLMSTLCATPAMGDGPCDKGFRDTTAAERASMTRILEAARQALPAAPAGWVLVNDDPPSVPQSLCMDSERRPWPYSYSRTFRRADNQKQAEIEAGTRAAADIMRADIAKKQPRLDALQAKSEVLVKLQVAFMEKGDMTRALELNEQMAVLQEEARRIMEEGDAEERSAAIMKEMMRDIEIGISVQVNPGGESPAGDDATAIAVDGSPAMAYRWDSRDDDSHQGGAVVLFGQWRETGNGGRRHAVRGNVPANFAHGVAVRVHADERRLESVIETIDFGALAELVAP